MCSAIAFAAGALMLAISMPTAAEDFKLNADLFAQKRPVPKKPSVDWNWHPFADQNSAAKLSVICGLTLIPADPKVDPKMRVAAPERDVTFKMRSVKPTICKTP